MRIKKEDIVRVVAGDDKGKTGKVLEVFPGRGKLIVEGANMIWEHVRRSQKHPKGGRIQRESELDVSHVLLVCRVKQRLCRKCGKAVRPEE
jgi:large subunit ribosomal protein L24